MPSIDMHVHLAPALDGVAETGPPALHRPEEAEAYLDRTGLDLAVVSVPPRYFRQPATAEWVRALNDGLLRAVRGRPRLRPLAYLPLENSDLALLESAVSRPIRGSRVSAVPRVVGR